MSRDGYIRTCSRRFEIKTTLVVSAVRPPKSSKKSESSLIGMFGNKAIQISNEFLRPGSVAGPGSNDLPHL